MKTPDKSKKIQRNYIKYFRVSNKLNQRELAELMGVQPSAISKWETGAAVPLKRHIRAMMGIFGCTYEELFPYDVPGGHEMPGRFGGDAEVESEADDGDAIALVGLWEMVDYRADADGDTITLHAAIGPDSVPVADMRDGGPWTVCLVPAERLGAMA